MKALLVTLGIVVLAATVKEAALKANAKDLLLFRTIPACYRSLPGALVNKLVEMYRAAAAIIADMTKDWGNQA